MFVLHVNVLKILESIGLPSLSLSEEVGGQESKIRILSGVSVLHSTIKKQECGWMLSTVNIQICKSYHVPQNSLCHYILRRDKLQARWMSSQTFRCRAGSGTLLPSSECALYCGVFKTLASTRYIFLSL